MTALCRSVPRTYRPRMIARRAAAALLVLTASVAVAATPASAGPVKFG
jgi:hypothetical protein